MPLGFGNAQDERYCSFCHKSEKIVGTLISGPSDYPRVYICDECVAASRQILEGKEDPFIGNPLLSEFLMACEEWIAVESAGQDATEKLWNVRRLASLMFADSVERPASDRRSDHSPKAT